MALDTANLVLDISPAKTKMGLPGNWCGEGSMEESAARQRWTRRQPRNLWRRSAGFQTRDPAPVKQQEREEAGESSDPVRGLEQVRRLLGFGLIRASGPIHDLTGQPVRARAFLESAKIEEKFFYHQHISANPVIRERAKPEGTIELVLPFDGEKHFTRKARRDVARGLDAGAGADEGTLVGFLALTGHADTDMGERLHLDAQNGSLPIRADLPAAGAGGVPDPLLADEASCVMTHEYQPRSGGIPAAQVYLQLHDPDTVGITELPAVIADGDDEYAGIVRQAGFKPELTLLLRAFLALPRGMADGAKVTVSNVFIKWPTRPSPAALRLFVPGEDTALRYNPERERGGGLEWRDVEMTCGEEPAGGDTREFRSPEMELSITVPGDLYRRDSIDGEVTITVNRLLSGTEARLFDATGRKPRRPELERTSTVSVTFSLILDDTFTRRVRRPHQQMHFGAVLPEEARIEDVATALQNQGFEVSYISSAREKESPARSESSTQVWLLLAQRSHGADTLRMLLHVEGRQYRTRRERPVAGGGAYHTTLNSGDLDIYAYGFLPGDSKTVVREMNALRRALRGRFERLPAWR